jgi:class 3 adenylate cyclase/tetratricopeptide (TPR) repeat protein
VLCPQCSSENLPGDKFCGECGHVLALPSEPRPIEPSLDEKIAKIQKYLPKGLTEKILAQRDRIEGERKQVTVMFCDLEGFTSLTERLGSEEAYGIMDQVYELLIHKVHDYEGTVNEMTGDGIMALFGAPIALEDAPQRAIRSALAIHREMAKFSDGLKQVREGISSLKMRVGIHTGPVVVGTLGNDLRVEFKAVGDTVNLASRMEGLAKPGTTCITEETHRITEGLFRFEALGEKTVKGKKGPVKVYKVIAPSTSRTRFDVSTERGLTPFIGREREFELLLDGFERAKRGRGQAFSIVSEAGIGKSRLLYEFRKAVSNEDVIFLEGRCLSYSRAVTYHPVIDIIRANFDIREGDQDSEIREKVIKGLKILRVDEALTLPYFLELLSVKDSGIDKIPISPEAKKDRIIQAYKLITLKGSEIRPLILAFEDLHWIDKSSEEVLRYVFESIPGARVLMVFTYRPEFVHTWGGKSYHSQVNLNRLSNRESLAMVSHLFGTEDIDSDLEELILEKTEGVPFFIEEFVRSLKDLKIIDREDNKYSLAKGIERVAIPSTIEDVIMARVDSLPGEAKEVLQTGSVIEREFSYELIKEVTGLPEKELLSYLSVLKDSELLYERGIYPQSTYIFKHALTRDVVYGSILIKRQQQIHEAIGNTIEELYKENIDEYYAVLTEHYIDAKSYEKGAEYADLAAKKALKAASFAEAIEYEIKRVSCFERLPTTDTTKRKIIDARTVLASYLINLAQIAEANDAVAPIADLVVKINYRKRLPAVYNAIGLYNLWGKEDYLKASRYLNEVLNISEEEKDHVSLWYTCINLGWYLSYNCEFEKGFKLLNRALDFSLGSKNVIGITFCKNVINTMNYILQGKIDFAYQRSVEILEEAEKVGDIFVRGISQCSYGSSCYFKGFFDKAKDNLLNGWMFCEKANHVAWGSWSSGWLGYVFTNMGEYKKAQDYYEKAISISVDARLFPSFVHMWKVSIARAKSLNNDQDIDMNELFKHYKKNRFAFCKGLIARIIAEILMNIEDKESSEVEKWIIKSIEADTKNGLMWFLANDYALYADLFRRKGERSKAKENLAKAIDIFKECGADGWVEKYEEELTSLS